MPIEMPDLTSPIDRTGITRNMTIKQRAFGWMLREVRIAKDCSLRKPAAKAGNNRIKRRGRIDSSDHGHYLPRRSFLRSVAVGTFGACALPTTSGTAGSVTDQSISGRRPGEPKPANPSASADAGRLLRFLACLPRRHQHRVVSGQHCGRGKEVPGLYQKHVVDLYRATGHWITMIGTDYGRGRDDVANPDLGPANRILVRHWKRGGLVTVTWHAANPWTGGAAWDRKAVRLADLLDATTTVHSTWMRQLDRVAGALSQLRDEGVVVLWRPFHEQNGGWFWWGRRDRAQFVAIWRWVFEYFTKTRNLNNLLWVYSPSASKGTRPANEYYPGNSLCDIVGLDHYGDTIQLRGYEQLAGLGKPFGLTEVGPSRASRGSFDYASVIASVKARYPATCFFQAWAWGWSIAENRNGKKLLDDPWIVGRDELDWRSDGKCGKASRDER